MPAAFPNPSAAPRRDPLAPLDATAERPASLARRRFLLACLGIAGSSAASGCATYRFGAATLYRSDIRTVHVPVIESDSFRRHLGERLTEAVAKQIALRTPYKVVGAGDNADSRLVCRLTGETKRVAAETRSDEPRLLDLDMTLQVEWQDRNGQSLLQRTEMPLPAELLRIGDNGLLVAEVGQTVATAQQKAIERLATQVVDQMEVAW